MSVFERFEELNSADTQMSREDVSRARKDNSPLNMNVLRKIALKLVSQAQNGRISKKKLLLPQLNVSAV